MKQYLDLLQDIKDNGEWKESARKGMPKTKSIFSRELRFNLQEGFPAVTTKKLYWKGVVGELLWFLKGDTNIKYLIDNDINIWNDDAYKFYKKKFNDHYPNSPQNCFTKEEFVKRILEAESINSLKNFQHMTGYSLGNCGYIYGKQWVNWGQNFNQIESLIKNIEQNPDSRYHIVTAWNPTDFLLKPNNAALPACHVMFQVYIRKGKYLDLKVIQRSCDAFLGLPFNIASYALLIHILASITGYKVGELIWSGNDIHYYENHQEQVDEILTRIPKKLSTLYIEPNFWNLNLSYMEDLIDFKKFCERLDITDFQLQNYKSYPTLKALLSVGE